MTQIYILAVQKSVEIGDKAPLIHIPVAVSIQSEAEYSFRFQLTCDWIKSVQRNVHLLKVVTLLGSLL